MATTSAGIKRALVSAIRGHAPLKATIVGGIHEAFAPATASYPFLTYNMVVSPYADLWGSRMIVAVVDVFAFARNPVDANNVDQLILNALDGAALSVDGQVTLICHRVADVGLPPAIDSEGRRVYQVGGSYEVWTDQPLSYGPDVVLLDQLGTGAEIYDPTISGA